MSNITSNATVTLTVNGKQAQDMLDSLKKKSQDLEKAIDNAARSGNKQSLSFKRTFILHAQSGAVEDADAVLSFKRSFILHAQSRD